MKRLNLPALQTRILTFLLMGMIGSLSPVFAQQEPDGGMHPTNPILKSENIYLGRYSSQFEGRS